MNRSKERLENRMKKEYFGPISGSGEYGVKKERHIKSNTIYRHFKGKYYYVLDVVEDCTNTGTGKEYVVYRALYGDYRMYVRELDEFRSLVDSEKYPHAKQKFRMEELKTTFNTLFGNTYHVVFKDKTKCVVMYTNWENVRKLVVDETSIGYYDGKDNKSLPITNDIWLLAEVIRAKELNIKPQFNMLETILNHIEMNINKGGRKNYDRY